MKKDEIKMIIRKELRTCENGLPQADIKKMLESKGFSVSDSELTTCINELEAEAAIYVRRVGASRLVLPNHRLLHYSSDKTVISKKFKDKMYKLFLIQNKFSTSLTIAELVYDSYLDEYRHKGTVAIEIDDIPEILDYLTITNSLSKQKEDEVLK